MTLPASGALSLADIAGEFGGTEPHALCEYYGAATGIPSSGTISISDFYGKSSLPLGAVFCGGYYLGVYCGYYLILSNTSGQTQTSWGRFGTLIGSTSLTDGYYNTYSRLNSTSHPAARFTATRTINGYSDWYLPSRNELNVLYGNKNSLPSGQGFAVCADYWSSSEFRTNIAYRYFGGGAQFSNRKNCSICVRAVRRLPI